MNERGGQGTERKRAQEAKPFLARVAEFAPGKRCGKSLTNAGTQVNFSTSYLTRVALSPVPGTG